MPHPCKRRQPRICSLNFHDQETFSTEDPSNGLQCQTRQAVMRALRRERAGASLDQDSSPDQDRLPMSWIATSRWSTCRAYMSRQSEIQKAIVADAWIGVGREAPRMLSKRLAEVRWWRMQHTMLLTWLTTSAGRVFELASRRCLICGLTSRRSGSYQSL